MNANVTFIKKHPSGVEKGRTAVIDFEHADRLKADGYVEIENYDELKAQFEEEMAKRILVIKTRIEDLKSKDQQEEDKKIEERSKIAQVKDGARQARMSTDDIKSEQPTNPGKTGKGGKNK